MTPALRLTPFYDEGYGGVYAFGFTANSGAFSGYTEVSFDEGELRSIGSRLREFPAVGLQSQVLWELGSDSSRLRFFIRDAIGHAAIEAALVYGVGNAESAKMLIPVEVAAVNRLGERLLTWASGERLGDEFQIPRSD